MTARRVLLTGTTGADALAEAAAARRPRFFPPWAAALGGSTLALLSRSLRISNAKLKAASGWPPRWRSARGGLRTALQALERGAPHLVAIEARR